MKKRTPTIIVYPGVAGSGWYWTLVAGNGERIADGCEAYAKKANALRAARRTQTLMGEAEIVLEDGK